MPKRWFKRIKDHFSKFSEVAKTPHSIALGFSIGTLIEVLPTPGINLILMALVAITYPKINKISMFGSALVWNPIMKIPLYGLSYKLGDIILLDTPTMEFNVLLYNQIYDFSIRFLLGNFIIAITLSAACYIIVRFIAQEYQEKAKIGAKTQ